MLKLEIIAHKQKAHKRMTKWNEFKGELEVIFDVTPFPTLVDETTCYHHFTTNHRTFP
jgi:hypothetical protein